MKSMPSGSVSVSDDLNYLHKAYRDGKLRLLVGAGASMRAGFPSWDALNRGLLSAFLKLDISRTDSRGLHLLLTLIPELTETVYQRLGREAIDLVWDNLEPKDFFRLVAEALYSQRRIEDLPVPSLHRQIAAMDRAGIFTTNYDPLLELAMHRLYDKFGSPLKVLQRSGRNILALSIGLKIRNTLPRRCIIFTASSVRTGRGKASAS